VVKLARQPMGANPPAGWTGGLGGAGPTGRTVADAGHKTERRRRARRARKAGHRPAAKEVTLGGSKQRRHLPASTSHEDKLHARQAGRRPGGRS
jgi:hypothetical protein